MKAGKKPLLRDILTFSLIYYILYNEFGYPGMYRFRQKILGHKQRVGIPSTPLNGGKT